MISWFRDLDGRAKFMILGLIVVVALGFFGILSSTGDAELEREEAIEIAEQYLDFTPETTDVLLIRQGFSRVPVWAVSFAILDPDGGRNDFLRQLTVEINAQTRDVIRVGDDGKTGDPNG